MPKRKGPVQTQKTARDRAIDAIINVASAQAPGSAGPILVRKESLGANTSRASTAKKKESPRSTGPAAPTALSIAMTKAGLVPEKTPATKPAPPAKADPIQPAQAKPIGDTAKLKGRPAQAPKAKPPKASPPGKKAKKAKQAKSATKAAAGRKPGSQKRSRSSDLPQLDIAARLERMQERQKAAAETIGHISTLTPDTLLALWMDWFQRAHDARSNFQQLANDYIEAIEGEWHRRAILARLDPDHFEWPTTRVTPGKGEAGSFEHAEGILGYLGYHVGKTGEPSSARRQVLLSRVFEGPLPPINGPDYMKEWSLPESTTRLRKMAESIASAVKSAKRHSHADYGMAIKHWEEDLA